MSKKRYKESFKSLEAEYIYSIGCFCRPSCGKLQFVIQQDLVLYAFEHIYNTNSDIVYASSKQK